MKLSSSDDSESESESTSRFFEAKRDEAFEVDVGIAKLVVAGMMTLSVPLVGFGFSSLDSLFVFFCDSSLSDSSGLSA